MEEIERPLGVSGLMRVKNEAQYVAASIDSVVAALDELIICYQPCTDDTPAILERKRLQYPNKIKLYYYEPYLYYENLTEEEFRYATRLPNDSPHMVSTYYNFTLSKATYRYAMKIDADQIYFTARLKELCDAYRTKKQYTISIVERLVGSCLTIPKIKNNLSSKERLKSNLKAALLKRFVTTPYLDKYHKQYVLKRIANEKLMVWLCGINLFREGGSYYIPIGNPSIFICNGSQDHCIFHISESTFYYPIRSFKSLYRGNCIIENFCYERKEAELYYGLLWYHTRWCKEQNRSFIANSEGIEYTQLKQFGYKQLKRNKWFVVNRWTAHLQLFYAFFLNQDKSYPNFEENNTKLK